jgi:hypothetical protein
VGHAEREVPVRETENRLEEETDIVNRYRAPALLAIAILVFAACASGGGATQAPAATTAPSAAATTAATTNPNA